MSLPSIIRAWFKQKHQRLFIIQSTNIVPHKLVRTSISTVPRTSPKDPIWKFLGNPDLVPGDVTKRTSMKHPNLTYKRCPWKVDSKHLQAIGKLTPKGPLKHFFGAMWDHQLGVSNFLFTFLSELIWLTRSVLTNSVHKVYLELSQNSNITLYFLQSMEWFLSINCFPKRNSSSKFFWVINTLLILSSNRIGMVIGR